MAKHRRRTSAPQRNGSLSPSTHVSLTLSQFAVIFTVAFTLIGGGIAAYWGVTSSVAKASDKADSIAIKFDKAFEDIKNAFKDQDNKRGQLDQKVTDVTSKLALEDQREQMIADTLTKISSQVDALRVNTPISGPGSGGGVAVGGGLQTKH